MKKVLIVASLFTGYVAAFAETPPAAPKAAKLIVFRNGGIYGSMAKYQVIQDNEKVTELKPKGYEVLSLTPGTHTIAPKNSNKAVTINAQDGQTYVVQYKTRFGLFGARPKLKVMSVAEAQDESTFFAERYQTNGGGLMNGSTTGNVNMKK